MNSSPNHLELRAAINQVVNDPQYKEVASIPLFSIHQIGLIVFAYTCVFGSIFMHLSYDVPLWMIYPIMIFGFYTAFTPLHDASHKALSSNSFLNDLLGTIAAFLLTPGNNAIGYRYIHMTHHRYVGNKDLDPDELLVHLPTHYFPFGYLVLLVPDILLGYWLFFKIWKRTPTRIKLNILGILVISAAFNIYWLTSPYWYEFLILFFIPNRLGLAYIAYFFSTIQHGDGEIWENHPFQATFKIKGNFFFLKSLLGQANHHFHHFMPHIPWFKYKAVLELANGVFKKQAIPEKSAFEVLDKHFLDKVIEKSAKEKKTIPIKITAIKDTTKDIKHFSFQAFDGEILPEFTAGSHIIITLPSGKTRAYSLVNPPFDRNQYQIAVKLEPNGKGGSKEMHELSVGDTLTISHPKNNFVLYEQVQKYILIAGGIGITPLLSMAHRLTELEKHFELHICAKAMENIPFQYELKHWSFAPNVDIHLNKNGKNSINLSRVLATPDKESLVYVCGPSGFNNWVKDSALELGWQPEQIKQELFSLNPNEFAPTKAFELVLNKWEKTITVEKDLTIIDALLMNNIKVDYTCLQGTCGTCIAHVVEGEVDHRDSVLSETEKMAGEKMCLCVSRAKLDRLVIDI